MPESSTLCGRSMATRHLSGDFSAMRPPPGWIPAEREVPGILVVVAGLSIVLFRTSPPIETAEPRAPLPPFDASLPAGSAGALAIDVGRLEAILRAALDGLPPDQRARIERSLGLPGTGSWRGRWGSIPPAPSWPR